jgi:hypothetical protein
MDGRRLVESWDRFNYSPKTQYRRSVEGIRRNVRQLQQRNGLLTPLFVVENSQKILHLSHEGISWVGNIPGLMDPTSLAEGNIPDIRAEVFQDVMNKRTRYGEAGEIIQPAVLLSTLEDEEDPMNGPVTFWTWNPKTIAIVEKNKKEEPFRTLVLFINDVQIGSRTARDEAVLKMLDYTFSYLVPKYEALGEKVRVRIVVLGDYHHGNVYKASSAEHSIFGLTTIYAQQAYGCLLLEYLRDPKNLQYVDTIDILTGNHEWDTFGAHTDGRNDLIAEERWLKSAIEMLTEQGKIKHHIEVTLNGRSRIMSIEKEGSPVNWPTCTIEDHGFSLFCTHKFAMRGEPMKLYRQFMEWASFTLSGVTHTFIGHYHHREFKQSGDIINNILGAYAGASSLEIALGLHADTTMTVGMITNAGFGMHEVPYNWLMDSYKCRGALKDADASGALTIPTGDSNFKLWLQGKRSEYVESLIWNKVHSHPPQRYTKQGRDFSWKHDKH